MGWFYGKHIETGKKIYGIVAFGLPFLIHGLYDFSLSEELLKTNDNLAFIGLSLAVLDVVLIILMIRFFLISRKKERCTDQFIEKTIEVNP
jgi:polyferredoxin